MKRLTNDGRNEQEEGRELIMPAYRNAEEEALPLGLSFESGDVAGARTFSRRQALGLLGGSLAGASLLSFGLADPANSQTLPFANHDFITLQSQAAGSGPRYLDGRTGPGTVGLAPHTNEPFTGTTWEVIFRPAQNTPGRLNLYCQGTAPGNRWLDGVTDEGSVQLAPTRSGVFTGTYWQAVRLPGTTDQVTFKCLGAGIGGNRYLIGRGDGSVGLAPQGGQIPGTKWKVRIRPQ